MHRQEEDSTPHNTYRNISATKTRSSIIHRYDSYSMHVAQRAHVFLPHLNIYIHIYIYILFPWRSEYSILQLSHVPNDFINTVRRRIHSFNRCNWLRSLNSVTSAPWLLADKDMNGRLPCHHQLLIGRTFLQFFFLEFMSAASSLYGGGVHDHRGERFYGCECPAAGGPAADGGVCLD